MDDYFETHSETETEDAAAALALRLAGSRLILLEGDLGAGKTAFVRGFVRGLGIDGQEVASPTFALVHEYGDDGTGRPQLRHLDLYRIEDLETLREAGLFAILDDDVPVIVEWPTGELKERPGAVRIAIGCLGEEGRSFRISGG